MAEKIPNEILLDIFSRLDIRSLFRVKFACCKSWRNMIDDDPCFVNTHLVRSAKSPGVPLLILDPDFYTKPELTLFHALREDDGDEGTFKTSFVAEVVMESDLIFGGSCNGLLCFYSNYNVFVCNPLLKQVNTISRGTILCHIEYGLGFAFDSKSNTYKIVQITFGIDEYTNVNGVVVYTNVHGVEVYTLGTNSWRKINEKPKYHMFHKRPVFAHGALHWNTEEERNEIVSFDLAKEEFYDTQCPDCQLGSLVELDGLLAIVNHSKLVLEIWLCDGTGKWTKKYIIDLMKTGVSIFLLRVMGMWKNGEIVLKGSGIFFMYNPKNDQFRRIDVDLMTDYTRLVAAFKGSLVSPN